MAFQNLKEGKGRETTPQPSKRRGKTMLDRLGSRIIVMKIRM